MNTCQAPNAVNVCIKIVTDKKLRESLQLVSMVHLSASGKRRNLPFDKILGRTSVIAFLFFD